jgi:mRNA deadenylase 3'-5' endonuclease subunit Ccr4
LSSQPAIKDGETEIRVMSWNILARGLCQPDETWRAPKDAYDWPNYRLWRTLEETIRFASDIICLEEADAYEEIKPYLHALGSVIDNNITLIIC